MKENKVYYMGGIVSAGLMASLIIIGQNRRISKLEKENSSIYKKYKLMKKERDSIVKGKENLNNKVNSLVKELKSLSKEFTSLINEKESLETEINILIEENKKIKIDNNKKEILSNEHFNNVNNLKSELSKHKSILENKNKEISGLNKTIGKLKSELSQKPKVEIKEVLDAKSINKMKEQEEELISLTTRCNNQTEKIRELKGQIRESKGELKRTQEELAGFKTQIKNITNSKNEDKEIVKQLTRTTDRVSKKVNKSEGGK